MRYFFVSYTFSCEGFSGNGNIAIQSDELPSRSEITSLCENAIEKSYPQTFSEKRVVIMGWQELTEDDYETFTSE